jgi:hypothetical protein
MTLLGKIFTLLIFIFSLFLMFVAMVVYATHRDWREAYTAANQKLQTAQADNAKLESQYQNQIIELNADHEAALQEVRKLESELETVARLNATTQGEVDELRQERAAALGAVAATEENNKSLTDDVVALRGSNRQNQQARDAAVITTLKATSELHTAAGQLQAIRERSAQLIKQLADAMRSLQSHGIDPTGDVIVPADGEITRTRREGGGQLTSKSPSATTTASASIKPSKSSGAIVTSVAP